MDEIINPDRLVSVPFNKTRCGVCWKVLNPHSLILTNFHVSILPWSAPGLKTEGEE